MGILDSLKRQAQQQLRQQVQNAVQSVTASASATLRRSEITLPALPRTLAELQAMPEGRLQSPQHTAALTVAALCLWSENREEAKAMLTYLAGPRGMTGQDWQFINDRFMDGRAYIPRSYFAGATVDNGYTPSLPYVLPMWDDPYTAEPGYAGVLLQSAGADSKRKVVLRQKPSTGQWFLWQQELLAGIRVPKAEDPWA